MGETISTHSIHNCSNNPENDDQKQNQEKKRSLKPTRGKRKSQSTLKQTKSKKIKKSSNASNPHRKNEIKKTKNRGKAQLCDANNPFESYQSKEKTSSSSDNDNLSETPSLLSNGSQQQESSRYDLHKIDTADALHLAKQTSNSRSTFQRNETMNLPPINAAAPMSSLSQNPFFNYLIGLRKKYKDLNAQELAKMGGQKWRLMSMEDKFPYHVMAKKYREYRMKRLERDPERCPSGSKAGVKNDQASKSKVSKKTGKGNSGTTKNSKTNKHNSSFQSYIR